MDERELVIGIFLYILYVGSDQYKNPMFRPQPTPTPKIPEQLPQHSAGFDIAREAVFV